MRRTWLAAGLVALSTLAALFALLGNRQSSEQHRASHGLPALVPGTAYVADVDRDQADVDLEFQPNSRYIVVISSLARSTGTFSVAASCREIAAPTFCPRPLPPQQPSAVGAEPDRSASSIVNSRTIEAPVQAKTNRAKTNRAKTNRAKTNRAKTNTVSSATPARTFAVHVTDGSLDDPTQYAKVAAHQVAVGRNVRIYLDDQQSQKDLAPGLVGSIADLFDNELIPRFASVFGTYRDVDGDGRFSVLLSPWLSRLQGGRTSIGGFVRGSDFESHLAPPFSNHCDMMYVNSQTIPGPHLRTLLIHEYTHAVSFSRRTGSRDGHTSFPEEEDWLNEALAHCAETLFGGGWTNLDYRISRYLNDTAAYPLVVEDYYRAGLWRCHGCRGATYLFLRYCVERFGAQTLTRLIGAPARGTSNLELATGCSFERLFRDWTLSLIDGSPTAHAPNQLASFDLYGPLGRWGLAGPRLRNWDVDSGAITVQLKGTSTAFIELSASRKPNLRRLHFSGARGTQLQISLVRLSDDSPQIDIEASWSQRTSIAQGVTGSAATPAAVGNVLQTTVRARSGQDLTIEQIAAEQNAGEDRAPLCFRSVLIKSIEVSVRPAGPKTESTATVPSAPQCCRVFELPAKEFSDATCPVVVKVVAVDSRGRRAVGWATVRERSPQQVAALAAARR